jgi:hypothetical protein
VTGNPQAWLGNGQNPHPRNSGIRKRIYRKFWKLMNDRNAMNVIVTQTKIMSQPFMSHVWLEWRIGVKPKDNR